MKAEIITIGDEILIGQIVNTNAAYIGEQLLNIGVRVTRVTTVGDNENIVIDSINKAFNEHDVIIITGGLGPTLDDITKKALCKYFNCNYRKDEEVYNHVKNTLTERNVPFTSINEEQAMVPEICKVLFNLLGTAPGMQFEKEGKLFFVMPGVPFEMKYIMDKHVIPYLKNINKDYIKVRTLMATGISESGLFSLLDIADDLSENVELAFLPSLKGIKLRIMAQSVDEKKAEENLERIYKIIKERAAEYIFSDNEQELEEVLCEMLVSKNLKLATAESCTGGKIADRLTNVSGSSKHFLNGLVTYSNASKMKLLDISEDLLNSKGAVSSEVALLMAENVSKKSNTDIGLSSTGIAGPTGDTPEKPLGLIWIGYSSKHGSFAKEFRLKDNRLIFKERASQTALNLLYQQIKKEF
jgi:nicotinamide-nucleotide amidase